MQMMPGMQQVADVAKQVLEPAMIMNEAAESVHNLPEPVKAKIKENAEHMVTDLPPELKTLLQTKVDAVTKALPESIKGAGKGKTPQEMMVAAQDIVTKLTPEKREEIVKDVKDLVEGSVQFVMTHPEQILEKVNKMMASMPPEFTNAVITMQNKLQQHASKMMASVPPQAVEQLQTGL